MAYTKINHSEFDFIKVVAKEILKLSMEFEGVIKLKTLRSGLNNRGCFFRVQEFKRVIKRLVNEEAILLFNKSRGFTTAKASILYFLVS